MTENDRETMMTERQDDAAAQADAATGTTEPVTAPATPTGAAAPGGTAGWARYAPSAPATRAPIRWGGVVWGLLLTLFAGVTLYVLASAGRAAEVAVWLRSLTPGSAWALAAAALGLIIVVSALLGGIRASQRRRIHPRG